MGSRFIRGSLRYVFRIHIFYLISRILPTMFTTVKAHRYIGFRAEKRSAQASAHPLSQAQGGNFLCVDCVCLLLEF